MRGFSLLPTSVGGWIWSFYQLIFQAKGQRGRIYVLNTLEAQDADVKLEPISKHTSWEPLSTHKGAIKNWNTNALHS